MNENVATNVMYIIVVIGVILFFIIYIFFKWNKNRKFKRVDTENNAHRKKIEQEVDNEIEDIKSDIYKRAVCYYIDVNYRKFGISDNDLKTLQKEYPQILARPFIDWTVVKASSGEKSYILEEKLRVILNANETTSFSRLKLDFEQTILKNAEKKAKEVLENF